ncbi:MAG: AMP-binding protein [Bryobacteraceae bacterium]
MARETLVDFLGDVAASDEEFLVYDDGYRSWRYRYREVAAAARGFAARLRREGLQPKDKLILWCENRPEWMVVLWGCLLEGVVVAPIDFRSSAELVRRVQAILGAKALVAGHEVPEGTVEGLPRWPVDSVEWTDGPPAAHRANGKDLAEIIFTSGATSDPKGVTITHRNVLANLIPVEGEVRKYLPYARPFRPIRFLNLLPLSHMFGQVMAAFIPTMLRGTVVFMRGYNPADIVRQIRTGRISVLVSVPKILEVLREYVVRQTPEAAERIPGNTHWLYRWWRYRRVHRLFGYKFWAFIVGAAPLDPDLEEFWSHLGFVVIQGYGLTETAPAVTVNHPFHTRRGAVGKPIAGVEVKVADDGEILVRGDNVTQGYFGLAEENAAAFADGWLHTGDIGELDSERRLYIRGRKKEMIVTPEGLNVFPEDVERVLHTLAGVRDCAVVGRTEAGKERVHAVLKLDGDTDAQAVIAQANQRLEDHQRIRGVSLWPGQDLPRTEGTKKLKRTEIRKWVMEGERTPDAPAAAVSGVEAVLARYAAGRPITAQTRLDDLGLSSLERVEVLMELEERFERPVDESRFSGAQTVAEIQRQMDNPDGEPAAPLEAVEFPRWNRTRWAWWIRRLSLPTWVLPPARLFAWVRTEGLENLRGVNGPVIFASNHQSHFDTPGIFWALPARFRYRVAPAMSKEFFKAHFFPQGCSLYDRFTTSLEYYLACLMFNGFPFPQRESGARITLRYAGELVSEGISILIFPEGRRTVAGEISRFFPGVGMMASRLKVPVVPVRILGFDKILHKDWRMAIPGRVRVVFGEPMALEGEDYAVIAARIEEAVRALAKDE